MPYRNGYLKEKRLGLVGRPLEAGRQHRRRAGVAAQVVFLRVSYHLVGEVTFHQRSPSPWNRSRTLAAPGPAGRPRVAMHRYAVVSIRRWRWRSLAQPVTQLSGLLVRWSLRFALGPVEQGVQVLLAVVVETGAEQLVETLSAEASSQMA